jgi:hypothetical protein
MAWQPADRSLGRQLRVLCWLSMRAMQHRAGSYQQHRQKQSDQEQNLERHCSPPHKLQQGEPLAWTFYHRGGFEVSGIHHLPAKKPQVRFAGINSA